MKKKCQVKTGKFKVNSFEAFRYVTDRTQGSTMWNIFNEVDTGSRRAIGIGYSPKVKAN